MPLPIASLLQIDLHLRITDELPEHEKQRLIALTAINCASGLGRAVSFLSTVKVIEGFEKSESETLLRELDCTLFTLGELESCLTDAAYDAVEKMFGALTKSVTNQAEATTADSQEPEPPTVETKARCVSKSGRVKTFKQRRNAVTGCYVGRRAAA